VRIFLWLALGCAGLAFVLHETKGASFVFSVVGWLILALVFYLADMVFGPLFRRS
jgi:hypothetical protein